MNRRRCNNAEADKKAAKKKGHRRRASSNQDTQLIAFRMIVIHKKYLIRLQGLAGHRDERIMAKFRISNYLPIELFLTNSANKKHLILISLTVFELAGRN